MKNKNTVVWEQKGSIGVLKISNPPQNFFPEPDFVDPNQLKKWLSNPDLMGVIIHGEGRHFSAGANLEQLFKMADCFEQTKEKMTEGKEVLEIIESCTVPVVAAIKGVCFGAGLEIALACHFRIATEHALFAFPESNHNLIPGLGGTIRLLRAIGRANAIRIITKGDIISSAELFELGLVYSIHSSKNIVEAAFEMLNNLTSGKRPEVIRAIVESIHNAGTLSQEEAMKRETVLFSELAYNEAMRQTREQLQDKTVSSK